MGRLQFQAANWNFADDFYQTNNLGVGSNPQTPASGTSAYGLNSILAE